MWEDRVHLNMKPPFLIILSSCLLTGALASPNRIDPRRQRPKAIYVRVYNGFAASMQN